MTRWLVLLTAIVGLLSMSSACGPECPTGQTKCGEGEAGICVNTQVDRGNCGACGTKCEDGQVCSAGKCAVSCQKDLTECGGTCVNTKTDNAHCGGCDSKCGSGEACNDGKCEVSCPDGQSACGKACVNTKTDAAHCGACDKKCEDGQACKDGKCEVSCVKDQTSCNGACTNTQTDRANCGACGTACEGGQVCNAGKCETSCNKDLTDCSGSCVNTKTDNGHCGKCGEACAAGETCKDGKCELICAKGTDKCGTPAICVDLQTSRAHCGKCDEACKAGEICNAGKCEISCAAGATLCTDKCVDTDSDLNNCGKCGTKCATGEVCQSGKCEVYCQKGFTDCKGACVNTDISNAHCGKCDTACKTGEACAGGKCVTACEGGEVSCNGVCANTKRDPNNCGGCGTKCKAGEVCRAGACKACSDCPHFATNIGSFGSDYVYDVAGDKDGNVYAVGYFYGFMKLGDITVRSAGGKNSDSDVFVVKFSPSGKPLWVSTAGGSDSDYGRGIAVDGNGNVYITGYYYKVAKFGSTSLTANGTSPDIFVAKLDKDGKWQWAKGYGSTSSDYGYAIATDSKGAAIVTGYFYSTVKFGAISVTSKGGGDIYVLKLKTDGTEEWVKTAGSTSTDYGYGVVTDSKDNVYVGGYFYSSITWDGTNNITSNGSADVFVVKLDTTGKFVYQASGGGTSADYAYDIAVDSAGNAYVTGSYYVSTTDATFGTIKLKQTASTRDAYVAKLDATGKWEWATGMGSGSSDYGYGVGVDSNGNVFTTGYFYDDAKFGPLTLTANGTSADIYVAQLDSKGKIVGATSFGSTSSDYPYNLAVGANDSVIVGGYMYNVMDVGDETVVSSGSADGFVIVYPKADGALCPSKGYTICNKLCTNTDSDPTNCGACSTLCKAGELCGGGKCLAPPTDIKLQELSAPSCCSGGYIALKNYGAKDLELAGLFISNAYSSGDTSISGTDNITLPKYTLKAGATVYITEDTPKTGDIGVSNVYAAYNYRHRILLCFGPCNLNDTKNVIDYLKVGNNTAMAVTGISMALIGYVPLITSNNGNSYQRVKTAGKYPTFADKDWDNTKAATY